MSLALVQLVLAAVLGPAPTPSAAQLAARELASTYDEASCAAVQGDAADGWDRAAIGEDVVVIPTALANDCPLVAARPAPIAADCNDPLASRWVGDMIGTCDMPRAGGPRPHALRPSRGRDPRAQRLLVEVAAGNDGAAPFVPTAPEREAIPAVLVSPPRLPTPPELGAVSHLALAPWRSIGHEPLLRPPRA